MLTKSSKHFVFRTHSLQRMGFTLIELIIAVAILLILLTLTVAAYSRTANADRIRSSARQVQSAFGGARDRAIKLRRRVGLRLLQDAKDPSLVTSFTYIEVSEPWTQGAVVVGRPSNSPGVATSPSVNVVRGYQTGWNNLSTQGLLVNGTRIRIPADGQWFIASTAFLSGTNPEVLILNREFNQAPIIPYGTLPSQGIDGVWGRPVDGYGFDGDDDLDGTVDNTPNERGWLDSDDVTDANPLTSGSLGQTYELELPPTVMAGQEPLRLSSGIAIDLDNSDIPQAWHGIERSLPKGSPLPPTGQGWNGVSYFNNGWGDWTIKGTDSSNASNDIYRQYSPNMDIMFSPQGNVAGALSAKGVIHLRLADAEDISLGLDPANPQAKTMLYSTLFTQTGYVGTFAVDITDSNSDQFADDPLKFTRVGSTVGR